MKLFVSIFCILISIQVEAQDDFYDISLTTTSGKLINLSSYKGKKLLIVVVNQQVLQAKTSAGYLGDIQAAYPEVSVLILPTSNQKDSLSSADIRALPELDKTQYGSAVATGDDSAFVQHPLLRWLSKPVANKHFDKPITGDDQYYVINESGVLYAVLDKNVSDVFLKEVLSAGEAKAQ